MRLLALLLLIGTAHAQGLTKLPPGQKAKASASADTLITGTANTKSHVYWSGTRLVDVKGLSWAMQGTVPQVAASTTYFKVSRAGAGGFSTSNYYKLAAPNVVQFAGDFTICAVYACNATAAENVIVNTGSAVTPAGYTLSTCRTAGLSGGNGITISIRGSTTATVGTAAIGQGMGNTAHIACFGRAGTTAYLKVDGIATFSGASTAYGNPVASQALVGIYDDLTAGPSAHYVFEVWYSSDAWNESAVAALQTAVMAKFQ
jgi:hypothetical protein